jgi:hypothetical protein
VGLLNRAGWFVLNVCWWLLARMGGVAAADEFSMFELLIGLPNIRVLRVEKHDGVLEIHLEAFVHGY